MIYLDNNATTMMAPETKLAMVKWCNMGNPSADYQTARECRELMDNLRRKIGELSGINTCCSDVRDRVGTNGGHNTFRAIINSGGSESNATIVHSVVVSQQSAMKPHICYSAVEHKSLIDCIQGYVRAGMCEASIIPATVSGHITVEALQTVINARTRLVCVMHANNETGVVNDVHSLGALAHRYGAIMHTDTVQTYGKFPMQPKSSIDSFCISFHKLGGPPGIGVLCVRDKYIHTPLVHGSQNDGLRGSTENIPGIAAAYHALQLSMANRGEKNNTQQRLKERLCITISKAIPSTSYTAYYSKGNQIKADVYIVFLSSVSSGLPGTILLSVVSHKKTVCNAEIKKKLAAKKIIVSVGSACNTASAKASHVLYALGADSAIRKGALRISIGDCNTTTDIDIFCTTFIGIVKNI